MDGDPHWGGLSFSKLEPLFKACFKVTKRTPMILFGSNSFKKKEAKRIL